LKEIRIVSEAQLNIATAQIVSGVFIAWKTLKNIWWRKKDNRLKNNDFVQS
jgi:hypothetical protein